MSKNRKNTPLNDPDLEEAGPSQDFARALQDYESGSTSAAAAAAATTDLPVGTKVRGRVISIGEENLLIDFGGRSEAVAETRYFRSDDGTVNVAVGDELDLFVVESGESVVLARSIRTDSRAALGALREAQASRVPVTGRVTAVNTGGLTVEIGSVRAFCPVSQIENGYCADPSAYVGRSLEFLVTSVEEGRGGAVLSRRALLKRVDEEQAQQTLATLKPGDERDGVVARLEAFGAFVNLGGIDGMVHVSEISHLRVAHPNEVLREGDRVRVRIMRIEQGKDGRPRIALSIKASAPDPWEGIAQRFTAGMRVTGVVARLADFGAFVTLAPGIDGLVHVSQVALHRIQHVREALQVGQSVEVAILAVEPDKKRISLSIRQLLEDGLPPTTVTVDEPRAAQSARPTAPEAPAEPTAFGLALRKAREDAERRQKP